MKLLLIILCAFPLSNTYAQNLIVNGSFDDANVCDEYKAKCSPAAWFYQNDRPVGFEEKKGYLSLAAFNKVNPVNPNESRQYWQTRLLCKTEAGNAYLISLRVSAALIGPNLNDLGIYFIDSLLTTVNDTLLQPKNYITFLDAKYKQSNDGWFVVEKRFVAKESAQFMVVGNFSPKSNSEIRALRKSNNVSIFVDDLSLTPVNATTCNSATEVAAEMYRATKRHISLVKAKPAVDTPTIVTVRQSEFEIDTFVISNIQFQFNSHKLSDTTVLKQLKHLLTKAGVEKIVVNGFTDDVGSESYNAQLSRKRAVEVASVVKQMYKVPDTIIQAEGRGVSKQYAEKSQNRRVEIYLYRKNK
jgi:outer membrane protein OmpA-like peptidoglycan-associated protein